MAEIVVVTKATPRRIKQRAAPDEGLRKATSSSATPNQQTRPLSYSSNETARLGESSTICRAFEYLKDCRNGLHDKMAKFWMGAQILLTALRYPHHEA